MSSSQSDRSRPRKTSRKSRPPETSPPQLLEETVEYKAPPDTSLDQTAEYQELDQTADFISEERSSSTSSKRSGADVNKSDAKQKSKSSAGKKSTQLGDFKVLKKLGQGGMGEVFLATQVSLDRKVAMKVLSKELAKKPGFVERFLREARSMAKIDHPNAVRVYAADSQKGLHFVAIEYIDGQSMQDWLDELGKLSVGDALHIVLMCADALRSANELNLVHRDIKPDNILVTKKGVVKVADFGLAKALGDEDMSLTQSGAGLGTPLYMAPEQARNAKHVDHRADIYALGCTFYHFLTGEKPFSGDTLVELIQNKEKGKFTPARKLNAEIPERLDLMIDKMIAKDPGHRYATWDEFISDLESLGLENNALSFIEGAKSASRRSRGPSTPSAATNTQAPSAAATTQSGAPVTSAEDAKRREQADKSKNDQVWIVKHKNAAGKVVVGKLTTAQILRGIQTEMLDPQAQARRPNQKSFFALAQFNEFEDAVNRRLLKMEERARSKYMTEMYVKIDKQERFRKRFAWLKKLTEGTLGVFGLILYLIIVFAILIGGGIAAYKYYPTVIEWVKTTIGSGS